MILKNLNKKLSSTSGGRKFFFSSLALIISFSLNCASGRIRVTDAAAVKENSVILGTEEGLPGHFLYISGNPAQLMNTRPSGTEDLGPVKILYTFGDIIAAVYEKKGISLFTEKSQKEIHISVAPGMLAEKTIRGVAWNPVKKSIFITYRSRAGSGVTECSVDFEKYSVKCATLTKENSQLKSNYVAQTAVDARGNTWFRYEPSLELGVSRIDTAGEWDHYDNSNSQLGSSSITIIRPEKKDQGFKGDNVWFVSSAGLSRLQYDGKKKKKKIVEEKKPVDDDEEDAGKKIVVRDYKDKDDGKADDKKDDKKIDKKDDSAKKTVKKESNEAWIFYGDKNAADHALWRVMGIHSWFTDAIVDIIDLEILNDSILIATKDAVYHFETSSMLRYVPKMTGGIEKNIIISIFSRNNHFFVKIIPEQEANYVSAFMAFDMDKKKWQNIDFWKIKNTFPINVTFIPYNSDSDIVLLKYLQETRVALFRYSDYSLQLINVELKK